MTEQTVEIKLPQMQRVGVVVERRDSANPWSDGSWRSVEAIDDAPADDAWAPREQGEGWQRFFAGNLDVELFKRETVAYKTNLSQPIPTLYIVLRPSEDDDEPDVIPFLATASPFEAEDYTESGEMIVDSVPMPQSLVTWVGAFIEAFHVDEPFKKRKQRRKSDSATGRRGNDMRPRNDR